MNLPREGRGVCVAIPVYNGGRTLRDTILNILEQTHREFEVIVYDDGSRDRTPEIVENLGRRDSRVRLHRCDENRGRGYARNALLKLTAGRLIAWQDADDGWAPTKLEEQLAALRPLLDRGEKAIVLSSYEIARIDEGGANALKIPPGEIDLRHVLSSAYRNYHFQLQAILGPSDLFTKAGGFDEELNWTEDLDIALKLLRAGIRMMGHPTAYPLATYNHTLQRAQPRVAEAGHNIVRDRFRDFARERGYDLDRVMTLRSFGYLGKMYLLKGRNQKALELALKAMSFIDPRDPEDAERIPAIAAMMMSAMRTAAAPPENAAAVE